MIAFEPDPRNFHALRTHVALNGVADRVELVPAAVGRGGALRFSGGRGRSRTWLRGTGGGRCRASRSTTRWPGGAWTSSRWTWKGMRRRCSGGAAELLGAAERAPRFVYVELHPWMWERVGLDTTVPGILDFLTGFGYTVGTLDGRLAEPSPELRDLVAYRPGRGAP